MVCEVEFKGHEMLPRAVIVLSIVFGLFGFGSYLSSSPRQPELLALKQTPKKNEQPATVKRDSNELGNSAPTVLSNLNGQSQAANVSLPKGNSLIVPSGKIRNEVEEPARFCGAETKKGTPCSRRVKGNNRCYQHVGMPAMDSTTKTEAQARK